jgi:hypothetical protein
MTTLVSALPDSTLILMITTDARNVKMPIVRTAVLMEFASNVETPSFCSQEIPQKTTEYGADLKSNVLPPSSSIELLKLVKPVLVLEEKFASVQLLTALLLTLLIQDAQLTDDGGGQKDVLMDVKITRPTTSRFVPQEELCVEMDTSPINSTDVSRTCSTAIQNAENVRSLVWMLKPILKEERHVLFVTTIVFSP